MRVDFIFCITDAEAGWNMEETKNDMLSVVDTPRRHGRMRKPGQWYAVLVNTCAWECLFAALALHGYEVTTYMG